MYDTRRHQGETKGQRKARTREREGLWKGQREKKRGGVSATPEKKLHKARIQNPKKRNRLAEDQGITLKKTLDGGSRSGKSNTCGGNQS